MEFAKQPQAVYPMLFIGSLSMLFAEVFSGSSQAWFTQGFALLVTFPLYLAHVLFFLWVALKLKKTSLPQMYILGMIFALYESWVTKVLWAGCITCLAPSFGTIFGIAIFEFIGLALFWHPVMAFILPVLIFEILTGKIFSEHQSILTKSSKKTTFIIFSIILASALLASGNKFDVISSNFVLLGSLSIVSLFYFFSRNSDVKIFELPKKSFIAITIYLIILYVSTFILFLPEKTPKTITPYLSIFIFYGLFIFLFKSSKTTGVEIVEVSSASYSKKDLVKFSGIAFLSVNFACLFQVISQKILIISYLSLVPAGIICFLLLIFQPLCAEAHRMKRD